MQKSIYNLTLVLFAALALNLLQPSAVNASEQWRYNTDATIYSVGDLHGDYQAFVGIMQKAGVIDANTDWAAGNAHFVSTGDLVDRGPESRKIMDLLIKLEGQAQAAGGMVHVLLGNHEVMNIIADRRYISLEEYAAFIPEEKAEVRNSAYQRYIKTRNIPDDATSKASFDEVYPQGYFGLHEQFGLNGTYGSWLKSKPFMIVVNNKLFTHGGLSETVAELGLEGVNTKLKKDMLQFAETWYQLVDKGVFQHYFSSDDSKQVAEALLNGQIKSSTLASSENKALARKFLEVADTELNSSQSPTWYRGTAVCHEYSEEIVTDRVLNAVGASAAFLGHSVTNSREVESRMNNKVFLQDTGMLSAHYKGQASILVHRGNDVMVIDEKHEGEHLAQAQGPRIWDRPYGMTNEEIEDFLLTAEITESKSIGTGVSKPRKLTLEKDGKKMNALYKSIDTFPKLNEVRRWPRTGNNADRYYHDLASYELDKLLNLDMMPPIVERKFRGNLGVVQYWLENGVTLTMMGKDELKFEGQCSRNSQENVMKIFDTLIYNDDRNTGNVFYKIEGSDDNWQLWIIDHTRAFRAKVGLPPEVEWEDMELSDSFRAALSSLTEAQMKEKMGKYLHKQQLKYLVRRQEQILEKLK